MSREALGEFEHHVLLALLLLGGGGQATPVVLELERRTGRSVSAAAVFIALRRLEQRGYVRSKKDDPEPGRGGRGRRTFDVTPAGVARLRDAREALQNLWSAADAALDPR
jgi:DNA-binding PadR family transcriptional regulator